MAKDTILEAAAEEAAGMACGLPPGSFKAGTILVGAVTSGSDDEDEDEK
jgi:hypothetical protein